jgi:hypothetical protein
MLNNREARALALGWGLCAALACAPRTMAQDTPAAASESAPANEPPAAESPPESSAESPAEGGEGEGIASATGFACAEMMDDAGNVRRIRRSGIVGLVRDGSLVYTRDSWLGQRWLGDIIGRAEYCNQKCFKLLKGF